MPNFMDICRTAAEFWRFKGFSILSDCWKFELRVLFRGSMCVIVQNFTAIGRAVAEIRRFIDVVARWRPSAILGSSDAHLDHWQRVLGGRYRCAKFGWNRCSSDDLIFLRVCLKTPIHASKIGVLGIWLPKWAPKRYTLPGNMSFDI